MIKEPISGDHSTSSPRSNSMPNSDDVNCLNVRAIHDYLRRKIPQQADSLFDNLPGSYAKLTDPRVELTDENNWVSSELVVDLFAKAKVLLDDPEAPYHIGFETITERNFGYIQKFFITTLGSPASILKRINHVNSQFNNTKVVETIYGSASNAVVRLHWRERLVLSSDLCRYNRGIYASIPTIWNLPPATIEEPYCQFEGDPYCQFNLEFHLKPSRIFRGLSLARTRKSQLLSALQQIDNDKLDLKKKYDEVKILNAELADTVETLKAINTASNLLVSQDNSDEILQTTMRFIVNALQFDRAIIMLVNDERTELEFEYAVGAGPDDIETHLKDYAISLDEDSLLAQVAAFGKPTLIKDVREAGLHLENRILANFDVSSFVICPLQAGNEVIGIVAADRHKNMKTVSEKDLDDLAIFANTIAETLNKARLKEELEASYINTVRALVRAIEEKDAYTRGHSERVATLSVELGRVLGMSEAELEYLRIGCLLHDVGKIGIAEAIVQKPKSLTDSEYNIIKLHPEKGAEIVGPVSFLKDYLYIIRNHHERYDGGGYPDGLAGDNIPLGAQIATVADAYDAMTSTRPYRQGMPRERASSEIDRGSGSQFAPGVVAAFHKLLNKSIIAN